MDDFFVYLCFSRAIINLEPKKVGIVILNQNYKLYILYLGK